MMKWHAVYIRETEDDNLGQPVALVRDPGLAIEIARLRPGVFDAEPMLREVELSDRSTGNRDIRDYYQDVASPAVPAIPAGVTSPGEDQIRAEIRAKLTEQATRERIEEEVRAEMEDAGERVPMMTSPGVLLESQSGPTPEDFGAAISAALRRQEVREPVEPGTRGGSPDRTPESTGGTPASTPTAPQTASPGAAGAPGGSSTPTTPGDSGESVSKR